MAAIQGDEALLLALAGGQSVREAARTAGVSERTAFRRAADPDFRQAVGRARGELLVRAVGRLADAATAAADTLAALLAAEAENVRLGAARAILDGALRGVEFVDLTERVAALEEAAAASERPGRGRWSA